MPSTKQEIIAKARSEMKPGEIRNIRIGPGREGMITIRKPRKKKPGFQIEDKRRAKVISSGRGGPSQLK